MIDNIPRSQTKLVVGLYRQWKLSTRNYSKTESNSSIVHQAHKVGQGSAELVFFARTDRTHCLSEWFGRTDPNRRVGRSLIVLILLRTSVKP